MWPLTCVFAYIKVTTLSPFASLPQVAQIATVQQMVEIEQTHGIAPHALHITTSRLILVHGHAEISVSGDIYRGKRKP